MFQKASKKRPQEPLMAIYFALLLMLLFSLTALYVVIRQAETGRPLTWRAILGGEIAEQKPIFSLGTTVMAVKGHTNQELTALTTHIGQVIASKVVTVDGKNQVVYDLTYGQEQTLTGVLESDLRAVEAPYQLDETVTLVNGVEKGETGTGRINSIQVLSQGGQLAYRYDVLFPNLGQLTDLTATDFVWVKQVPLREGNTAEQNTIILERVLKQTTSHAQSYLIFPTGRFLIGEPSSTEDISAIIKRVTFSGGETTLMWSAVQEQSALFSALASSEGVVVVAPVSELMD